MRRKAIWVGDWADAETTAEWGVELNHPFYFISMKLDMVALCWLIRVVIMLEDR